MSVCMYGWMYVCMCTNLFTCTWLPPIYRIYVHVYALVYVYVHVPLFTEFIKSVGSYTQVELHLSNLMTLKIE